MPTTAQATHQRAVRQFAFDMAYTGTLLDKAEVRTKLLDGTEHALPVVCMDIELDNEMHTHMHVEHPFPMGAHDAAKAEAAKFKRGMRVSVTAPALDMRLVARNATAITPQPQEPAAPAAPTTPDRTADLFQEQAA
jgi:hypothetical protein